MKNQQTISVTGATGYMGYYLIQTLLNRNFRVKALYRNSSPDFKHPNLIWIKGSLKNSNSLLKLISESSSLIHCASIISIGNYSDKEVMKVNVDGTKTIIDLCVKLGVRLIYISSSNAVKETKGDEIFDENRPYKTKNDFAYSYSKALSEQAILASIKENNLKGFILRPSAIVGPPDYLPSYFGITIMEFAKGKIPAITSGGYNIVDLRDLCTTTVNSIEMGKNGEIYLVGGHYKSILQVSRFVNPLKKMIVIPIDVMIWFLPFILLLNKILKLELPISKESLITLKNAPTNMTSKKAIKELNHKIRPTSETIDDLIVWFKKENKL